MAALTPTFHWAQSRRKVFVTISLVNCEDVKHNLLDSQLQFSGHVGGKAYSLDFELPHSIDTKNSKFVSGRNPRFELAKADESVFWTRLCKNKRQFKMFCKVDFDKWKDEDELYGSDAESEEEEEEKVAPVSNRGGPEPPLKIDAMGLPPLIGGMTQEQINELMAKVYRWFKLRL
uniref:CS domain-containing protein n=1 Tax=Lotharella oceanica TaxID=641309 RepID=A0A7S2XAQ0_9EUKA